MGRSGDDLGGHGNAVAEGAKMRASLCSYSCCLGQELAGIFIPEEADEDPRAECVACAEGVYYALRAVRLTLPTASSAVAECRPFGSAGDQCPGGSGAFGLLQERFERGVIQSASGQDDEITRTADAVNVLCVMPGSEVIREPCFCRKRWNPGVKLAGSSHMNGVERFKACEVHRGRSEY